MDLIDRVLAVGAGLKEAGDDAGAGVDAALADYRLQPEPSPELTYAVIGMLRAARRHAEALDLMLQRRPAIPAKAGEIAFHELELHFRCGQREDGLRLLDAFLAAGHKMRPSWKRFVERVQAEPKPAPAARKLADHLDDSPAARQDATAFGEQLLRGLRRPGFVLPSRPFTGVESAAKVLEGEIWLNAGAVVPVTARFEVDWLATFPTKRKPSLLSFYSLQYVGGLVVWYQRTADAGYLAAACGIARSFLDFADASPQNRTTLLSLRGGGSNDHATSTRTRALLALLQVLVAEEREPVLAGRIARLLHAHALFLFNDERYRPNNHGVMSDLALAELGSALGAGTPQGRRLIDKALARLAEAVRRIFDDDGLANENSTVYHQVNTDLFDNAVQNCAAWGVTGDFPALAAAVVARAREALRYCVWPDGGIPPIGDSFVVPGAAESIDAPRVFRQSHFGVVKSPDFYLSFICGRRGNSHKHVDDTSVTLRYLGEDVLIDGGRHHYDGNDPYRQCVSSTFGHSGIFPLALDGLHRRGYTDLAPAAAITGWTEDAAGVQATGEIRFAQWGLTIVRTVAVAWPARVVIADRVAVAPGFAPVAVRQSWLLGKAMVVLQDERQGSTRTVVAGTPACTARFVFTASGTVDDQAFTGATEPQYRGWCSEARGPALPTTELARVQAGTAMELRAEISLERRAPA